MKVQLITPFKHETSSIRDKVRITEAIATMKVDDVEYKEVHLRIYTGQMVSAAVVHLDFTPEITEALSAWWYGVNFAEVEYEIGEEFILDDKLG